MSIAWKEFFCQKRKEGLSVPEISTAWKQHKSASLHINDNPDFNIPDTDPDTHCEKEATVLTPPGPGKTSRDKLIKRRIIHNANRFNARANATWLQRQSDQISMSGQISSESEETITVSIRVFKKLLKLID